MPTLDWLNRANAFSLQAKVPRQLLIQGETLDLPKALFETPLATS